MLEERSQVRTNDWKHKVWCFFCSINGIKKKKGNTFLLFSKKSHFENMENSDNSHYPTSQMCVFFCSQEQKTISKNTNQTNPISF